MWTDINITNRTKAIIKLDRQFDSNSISVVELVEILSNEKYCQIEYSNDAASPLINLFERQNTTSACR